MHKANAAVCKCHSALASSQRHRLSRSPIIGLLLCRDEMLSCQANARERERVRHRICLLRNESLNAVNQRIDPDIGCQMRGHRHTQFVVDD